MAISRALPDGGGGSRSSSTRGRTTPGTGLNSDGTPVGGGWEYYQMVTAKNSGAPAPPAPPGDQGLGGPPPVQQGPSAADIAAANAAAALAKANKEGKDRTAKENAATQSIIDTLLKSLTGYEKGRDTGLANADTALGDALSGILANYTGAVGNNLQDQASKSAANVTNRARERTALLSQVLSQGGGETDALRAVVQAFQNFDANQLGVDRAFFDTERQINSQIAGANSQAETSRRTAWQQFQEARGQVMNDYYKNYSDVWTNAQRTGAQNTNIDSDSSTGFTANYGGKDAES